MSLIARLTERSWDPATSAAAAASATGPEDVFAGRQTMLHIFLVIVSVIFMLFFLTFIAHSQYPGFETLTGEPWKPLASTTQLWINTGVLVLASLMMHLGLTRARQGQMGQAIGFTLVAAFFSLQFMLAQLWLWRDLHSMGHTLVSNPSHSYFYLMTGVHALHLAGGLVIMLGALVLIWRRAASERLERSLKLCSTYWHYLLGLWLVLFVLLTRSPETYRTIAILCGLG